jgi:hypothetical protein
MSMIDIWAYRDRGTIGTELVGYKVEAIDGGIGKIDEATTDVGASYVVVDTGPWIFGKKVLLPAGVIQRVDADDEVAYVDLTKDQIKNAPELDESSFDDATARDPLGSYYAGDYAGDRAR